MPETREPKKGKGVPKETRGENSIAELQEVLSAGYPEVNWDGLGDELELRGLFESGMQQQIRIMARTAVDMLPQASDKPGLIQVLGRSPSEKVRGVSAFVVPLVNDTLESQLSGLLFTGALEGTWPRELSATVLHNLIIEHGADLVLPKVKGWTADPDPAIRRLVVEAFRPRGVMLAHIRELKLNPAPLRDLLMPLLDDSSDYVRKAVANNLNDVSKDNPTVVLRWSREWYTVNASPDRRWVINRALRTLVNDGDPEAMLLLGYASTSSLAIRWLDETPVELEINQLIPIQVVVTNRKKEDARILLILSFDEPGKGKSRRTSKYQLWRGTIPAGDTLHLTKNIHFVDNSRQAKEGGTYRLQLKANGQLIEERTTAYYRNEI
jgi:3-methyladenine DNA glycosylase AlkC